MPDENVQTGQATAPSEQTAGAGAAGVAPTDGAGAPAGQEAAQAAAQPSTVKLKVSGKDIDWNLQDPETVNLLQKGYHYSQGQEALRAQEKALAERLQRIDELAQFRAQQLLDERQKQDQARQYAELEAQDPVAASVKRMEVEMAGLKSQLHEKTTQLTTALERQQWDRAMERVKSKYPDFGEYENDLVYAQVALRNTSPEEVAERISRALKERDQKAIASYTEKLKAQSNMPPAPGYGAGVPVVRAPVTLDVKKADDLRSPGFIKQLTERLAELGVPEGH